MNRALKGIRFASVQAMKKKLARVLKELIEENFQQYFDRRFTRIVVGIDEGYIERNNMQICMKSKCVTASVSLINSHTS